MRSQEKRSGGPTSSFQHSPHVTYSIVSCTLCLVTPLKLDGVTVSVASGLGVLSNAGFWDTIDLVEFDSHGKRQTFCIEPGELILAMTYERITVPDDMIAIVEGRSTYARVGLSMHQTAPWIQPGWLGKAIVLEIFNMGR